MNDLNQKQLGKTLWNIADQLRGAMNADDFRDYMLSFLFLRYLSENYEMAAKKELGKDYPDFPIDVLLKTGASMPLASLVSANNPDDIPEFEKQMRRKVHYVIKPDRTSGPASPTWPAPRDDELLKTLQEGFKYIENESFQSTFQGLFSEINLGSDKLGKTYVDRNAKLCTIITEIAEGLAEFSTDIDTLGDAYEYLIGQFAAGSGKKAGEFYTPQQISDILSAIVTLDSQEPTTGKKELLDSVLDFACGSGSLLLNVRKRMGPHGIGKIYGQEKNITTYNLARMNMLLHGVKDTEFEIYHGDTLTNDWDMLRELNPAKKPQFDAVVANPPFSYRWEPTEAMGDDVRFKNYGLAPKSAADFAFLLHGFHLPEGRRRDGHHPAPRRAVPRRRGRTHPHQAAQGRPHRHGHRPARQPVLLHRHPGLHPRAQEVQEAGRRALHQRRRALRERQTAEPTDGRAHRQNHRHLPVPQGSGALFQACRMERIAEEGYNLNISRYISTAEQGIEIDLSATHDELIEIEKHIANLDSEAQRISEGAWTVPSAGVQSVIDARPANHVRLTIDPRNATIRKSGLTADTAQVEGWNIRRSRLDPLGQRAR